MSAYRTLNQTVLAKIEVTSGTDSVPVIGTDAVLVEDPAGQPDLQTIETDEVTGALDARAPIPAGGTGAFNARIYMHGSNAAGTTAPECSALMRACGWEESALAADVTGTAQAGAAGSITLHAGASAVNDFYNGRVIQTTGGTGPNQTRIITAYVGSTKVATVFPNWTITPDATTTFSVKASHTYKLQSALLPTATIYQYLHRGDGGNSKLMKVLGAAGNVRLTLQTRAGCYYDFTMQGSLVAPADVAHPGAATYQNTRPHPFIAASVYLDQVQIKLSNFTLDAGNEVTVEEDPNKTFGYDVAGITRRRTGGTMRLPKELESVRNAFNSWKDGTTYTLTAVWGSTAGNRMAFLAKNVVFQSVGNEDVQGFHYDSLPFRISASGGVNVFQTYW